MATTVAPSTEQDHLPIGGRAFRSRLMVGTGKYADNETMVRALEASGTEIVTVAVRRVDLNRKNEEGTLYHLDPHRFFLLANTAGCYTADDAVRYARLAREAGFNDFIKLEVIGDKETLLPDTAGLLAAARTLRRRIPVLGITGTGGAGKSSLTDELVRRFLADFADKRVAILSVDPTQRRTGGALLGAHIRMNAINNPRAFMRSIATGPATTST